MWLSVGVCVLFGMCRLFHSFESWTCFTHTTHTHTPNWRTGVSPLTVILLIHFNYVLSHNLKFSARLKTSWLTLIHDTWHQVYFFFFFFFPSHPACRCTFSPGDVLLLKLEPELNGQVRKARVRQRRVPGVAVWGRAELRALEKSHNYRARQECQPASNEVGLSGPGRTCIPHRPVKNNSSRGSDCLLLLCILQQTWLTAV